MVFDGRYGKPGHKRQRYRCYPSGHSGNGESFHRFAPALPRQVTVGGVCASCERDVAPHEGPQGPRRYAFSARDVAEALIQVGGGATYCDAAARTRQRAHRFPHDEDGEERYSRHGQLVQDWVEVFAPIVFEPLRRGSWPEDVSLVVDHLGFRVHDFNEMGQPKVGPVAFNILAAMSYDNGYAQLWSLRSYPTARPADFKNFFSRLDGVPPRVVTDGHGGTISAAQGLWPEAELYRSDWHLQKALQDYLVTAKLHGRTRIQRALNQAFINANFWESFDVVAYRHRKQVPKLWAWLERYGPEVEEQLRRRPDKDRREGKPTTTGGLETKLAPLKTWLKPRVHGFRNRERLDRLLMLMQLRINGQDDVDEYTRAIRDWLIARDGKPAPRRLVTDAYGTSSLLSQSAQKARRVPGSKRP